ncbi:helix-turn-helix domain-containing protein [Rhodococcus sp. MSC1_016]|jgi:hypothetical protein|uniref:helix-turn-helix domain-containing protein n=1 Tax=Rhodococcus sp. MSC1_016 TaxID=2909266 RepID=UPI00202E4BC5|nr:helix-turn-helix domain-containing protein [Rhodococcus sp. MSC1_016]
MSVRRGPRKADHFTILDNAALGDERLSFRARGVLAFILSKPADWRTSAESLARAAKEGRDAIRTALRELKDAGYIVYEKIQDPQTGHWSTISTVYELPIDLDETDPQDPVAPRPEKPTSGNPTPGNPGLTQRNVLPRTETNHHRTTPRTPAASTAKVPPVVVVPKFSDELNRLAAACQAKGLPASWDTLSAEKADAIAQLLEIHGVEALASHALKMHTPGNPTRHAGGLLNFWRALPTPRPTIGAKCDECDEYGWRGYDASGGAIKCPCRRSPAAHLAA